MTQDGTPDQAIVTLLKTRENLDGSLVATIATPILGFGFGFFLNKSRVIEPKLITQQFHWTKWQMMKVFLSASGASGIALSIVKMVSKDIWIITRMKSKGGPNLASTILGGAMLGAGMALSGGCPGLIFAQVGAAIPNSLLTWLGGACGAFTYGILEPNVIKPNHLFESADIPDNMAFLDNIINVDYSIAASVFGACLIGAAKYLETLFPFENEMLKPNPKPNTIANLITNPNWSPIVAGIGIGLLQLPTGIILGNTVGGSSAYACATGQWLRFCSEETVNKYSHFKGQYKRWWQLVMLLSAAGGSAASVYLSGGDMKKIFRFDGYDGIEGVSPVKAFLGGFVMIFGSRLAKGCASGHGLSGMGLLSMASFAAVAAMFAGGAVVGYGLKKIESN